MQSGGDVGANGHLPLPAESMSPPRLVMRGIRKRYGATIALNQVDFEAKAGEVHALLGENGAGKSTLMQILAGLTHLDSGEIELDGVRIAISSPREARRRGIAMVHQHFTLVPAFTVAENLALDTPSASWQGVKPYRAKMAAMAALDYAKSLGWDLPAETKAAELSVGTQQRVEIVKALATDAQLLIFDEPTAVLSRNEIEELFTVLRQLRASGKTVLLIAHKLAEILAVADRVTVLRRGVRVASVSVADTDAERLAAWMIGPVLSIPPTVPPPDATSTAPAVPNGPAPYRTSGADSVRAAGKYAPMGDAHLLVSGLRVRGDRGEIALRDLAFGVGRHEIFGIGGVDGNGQTEFAEVLTGLRPVEAGSLTWERTAFQPGTAPRIGYIPQDRRRIGLATTMSVADNLLFDAVRESEFRRGPFLRRKALGTLAATLIQDFDIRTSGPDLPTSALSGGNQQKIVVARALRGEPDLIVAMNPTRGLDIGATRFVHSQLRQARDRGAAIVLISTDLDELAALADRTAILSNGQLTEIDLHADDETQLGLLLGGVPNATISEVESNA
ncbi:MAG: nucleoside transporter ATP-binding protein [Chthonomonadales bacterium]|nr:nucleoside transporter ATP-binding protein [Chthonomonadales bacterium]